MQVLRVVVILVLLASIVFCLEKEASLKELAHSIILAKTEQERESLINSNLHLNRIDLFHELLAESEAFRIAAKYSEAQIGAEIAFKIAEQTGVEREIGTALFQLGEIQYYRSKYQEASDLLTRSLEIAKKNNDELGIIRNLLFIGNVYLQQGEYSKADDYLNQSLQRSEAIGNDAEKARILNRKCLLEQDKNDYDRAAEFCAQSLELRRKIGDPASTAESLLSSGLLYYLRDDYEKAMADFNQSLQLYEQLGYPYYISYLSSTIGSIYFLQNDYLHALDAFETSLKINQTEGDPRTAAYDFHVIGEIHAAQGNYEVAMQYSEKALALFQSLKMDPVYAARAQNLMGIVQLSQNHFDEARDRLIQSLKIYEQMNSQRDVSSQQNTLGELELKVKNYKDAEQYFRTALQLSQAADIKNQQAIALKNLARIALLQGEYETAIKNCQKASPVAAELQQQSILWEVLQIQGQAYAALHQPELAKDFLNQSISILEDLRGKVAGGEEDRQRFFASRIEPYYAMIEFLFDQKDFSSAVAYAERVKARVLVETLRATKTDPEQFMSVEERAQEKKLQDEMGTLNLKLIKENQKTNPDQVVVSETQNRLQKSRSDNEAFFTALYASHPELRIQRGEIPNIALSDAIEAIPNSDTAVLEYVVTEDKTYLFALSKDQELQAYSIAISRKEVAEMVEEFRKKLGDIDLSFSETGKMLYNKIIAPVEAIIRAKRNLLIIPDAELWNLPFAVLQSGANRFLMQDHVIVYVPSIAAFREMEKVRNQRNISKTHTLFALGNPITSGKSIDPLKKLFRNESLSPLPDAESEVKAIANIYGQSRSRIYIGKDASEDHFKSEANQYATLHIATHGILNDVSPLYSQLVLSPGTSGTREDGLLEAWEIMKLKLKADLAVLSACDTARGKIGSGEGMIGLSWALLVAGVPTTVVSQWKVESKSTSELMIQFHRALVNESKETFPIAAAFQQTALKFMQHPYYKHPFYWGGFVVIGAGR
jgi:CHAT domain-containing protein/uncharacterized protein HemY